MRCSGCGCGCGRRHRFVIHRQENRGRRFADVGSTGMISSHHQDANSRIARDFPVRGNRPLTCRWRLVRFQPDRINTTSFLLFSRELQLACVRCGAIMPSSAGCQPGCSTMEAAPVKCRALFGTISWSAPSTFRRDDQDYAEHLPAAGSDSTHRLH